MTYFFLMCYLNLDNGKKKKQSFVYLGAWIHIVDLNQQTQYQIIVVKSFEFVGKVINVSEVCFQWRKYVET